VSRAYGSVGAQVKEVGVDFLNHGAEAAGVVSHDLVPEAAWLVDEQNVQYCPKDDH
jgi:hypothetical protein